MSKLASASSPGKVLICGGYLVVEAPNVGISIGVSARFTTRVTDFHDTSATRDATGFGTFRVKVNSPQFQTQFEYELSQDAPDAPVAIAQLAGPESPFLYNATLYSFANIAARRGGRLPTGALTADLLASNDFYSQRAFLEEKGVKVTAETLRTVPHHNPIVGKVSKTGLGSSAALTTSYVACLHAQFGALTDVADSAAMEEIHRVAQVAHSVAQGKIGSGFDVFTAVYGTNVYTRFPAALIESMMAGGEHQPTAVPLALLQDCIAPTKQWVTPRRFPGLPPRLRLLLADIHQGGSSTPGMVSKIMAWRKSVRDQPDNLWDRLARANESYIDTMSELHAAASADAAAYNSVIDALKQAPVASWTEGSASHWTTFVRKARDCRTLLRDVGVAAGVEVEPPALTPLLDATAALPGVVAAGCPGAGGYDAIFALVLGDEAECRRVEEFWEGFAALDVCPLLVREDNKGILLE